MPRQRLPILLPDRNCTHTLVRLGVVDPNGVSAIEGCALYGMPSSTTTSAE